MKFNKTFAELCTPAKLYFCLSILCIFIGLFSGIHVMAILSKLFFAFIWTFILSWLCKKGLKTLSWFLVLLPFLFIMLVLFGVLRNSKHMNSLNPMMMMK